MSRRAKVEVSPTKVSANEKRLLDDAKEVEKQSLVKAEVVRAAERAGVATKDIMRVRWVLA